MYPDSLCDYCKCLLVREKYDAAIANLNEAITLGSTAGRVLLGLTYSELALVTPGESGYNYMQKANEAFDGVNVLSDTVSSELNNSLFQVRAAFFQAIMCRMISKNLERSYELLQNIVNYQWYADDLKDDARNELKHYKRGILGGLKYID